MSEKVASIFAELGLKSDQFDRGLKNAKTGLFGLKSGLTDAVSNLTGLNVGALGAAGAVGALASGLKFAIDQAAEAEQVQAKLTAVLKSTGGAAGLSAAELNNMADSMSGLNAIDDEAITNAQALMLTFTQIGRETFPGAMQAAADMSAVLGQDLNSSVIMLGKALNDPIKGITALSRAGVSFTTDQKEMIKSLQESGDLMGAQKIVLQELSREFGGAGAAMADTYAGKLQKLSIAAGNLGQTVGEAVLPAVTDFISKLSDGIGVIQLLIHWDEKVAEAEQQHAAAVAASSKSYEEYSNEILRAAQVAGKLSDEAIPDQIKAFESVGGTVDEFVEQVGGLTEAEWEGIKAADDWNSMAREQMAAAKGTAGEVENLSDAQDSLGVSLDTVMDSMKEMTAEMLFQKAAANLDAEAALELGRSLGVINETTYETLSALDALREKYDTNADGAIDAAEAAAGYASEVERLAIAEGLLVDKNITVTAEVNGLEAIERLKDFLDHYGMNYGGSGTPSGEFTPPVDVGTNYGAPRKAIGGPVSAGSPYLVGERGPELFVPSSAGQIVPNNQLSGMAFTIQQLTVIANSPADLMRQLMAVGSKTRLAALGGMQYQGA